MDLSTPRRLRLGASRTHFAASLRDGVVRICTPTEPKPMVKVRIHNALKARRYVGALETWKNGIACAIAAGATVEWTVESVDFGEELPVTGPALGGAPPARRSYAGPLPFGGAR